MHECLYPDRLQFDYQSLIGVSSRRLIGNRLQPRSCTDQHQSVDGSLTHGGHLRRDPATQADTRQDHAFDTQSIEELQHDDRQVARVARPLGALRSAIAGQVRHDHVVVLRKLLVQREPAPVAERVVQVQHDRTAALAQVVHVEAGDVACPLVHGRGYRAHLPGHLHGIPRCSKPIVVVGRYSYG